MSQIHELSIFDLHEELRAKRLGAEEIARACLERIEKTDPTLRCFLNLEPDRLLAQAAGLDADLAGGATKPGLLTGIPIAVKDNMVAVDSPTTCASKILENYRSPYDATVVARLKSAGALLLGKTNCDEFAMGSSTENSAYFPTRNPWDTNRVPGGSSGGSAAAVAAYQAPGALGSDTGGSIRQPAAFCGVVGLKPTYGRVSRYGLVAFASSLDQIGPLARNTRDVAILLGAIAGHDPVDSTSADEPVDDYLSELGKDIRGLRIGVPSEWFGEGLDTAIAEAIRGVLKRVERLGCRVSEVSLPNTRSAIGTYYIIAPAEASANLARYDAVKYGHRSPQPADLDDMYVRSRTEGFGAEVKRRIMIGTYVLSSGYYDAYYLKASKVRTLLCEDYARAFQSVDLLLGPTTPSLPFALGEKTDDPLAMYLSDVYTVTANLAGIPAMSLPCGFANGLPIGLQLLGPHFSEGMLLRAASAIEQDLDLARPVLAVDRAVSGT